MNVLRPSPLAVLRRSRGVGIVTAVFLLVALALLGIAIVNLSSSQQVSSQLDVQGARAYQAARAGIEWGLFQRLRNNAACAASGTKTSFDLPAGTTLSGFAVTVVCTSIAGPAANSGAAGALDRYRISATACNKTGGECPNTATRDTNPDYVQRIIEVQL
jgi:MSHA biogenesis protein MshP